MYKPVQDVQPPKLLDLNRATSLPRARTSLRRKTRMNYDRTRCCGIGNNHKIVAETTAIAVSSFINSLILWSPDRRIIMNDAPVALGPDAHPNLGVPLIPPPPQLVQHPVPAAQGGVPPPAPQPVSYHDKYLDHSSDVFQGNYINLYNEYRTGASTPLTLRNTLYRDGNTGVPLHILLHIRLDNAPDEDPGVIVGYHRLTRHDPRFGQPPTAHDNIGVAFFGDVVEGQAPMSVQLPDSLYNQLPAVQVPTAARMG